MKRSEVFWSAIGTAGLEHLVLEQAREGIQADGLVLRYHNEQGLRLAYQIICDPDWRTRQIRVQLLGEGKTEVKASSDGKGSWTGPDGQTIEYLKGCLDVDVMATPFTNTLAIRRLGLAVGESREIEVAYVRIPDLELSRARQRYTCLEKNGEGARYLYESLEGDFKAELTVDVEGLVLAYQGLWERVI
jgi:uncharacterized protein